MNTNLEEISDWLTKILVGLGLSQISQVPSALNSLSSYLSEGIGGPTGSAKVFALAIIVYFSVVGFIGGYLVTRLVLQGAFYKADQPDFET